MIKTNLFFWYYIPSRYKNTPNIENTEITRPLGSQLKFTIFSFSHFFRLFWHLWKYHKFQLTTRVASNFRFLKVGGVFKSTRNILPEIYICFYHWGYYLYEKSTSNWPIFQYFRKSEILAFWSNTWKLIDF